MRCSLFASGPGGQPVICASKFADITEASSSLVHCPPTMVAIAEGSPGIARSASKMPATSTPSVSNTTATYVDVSPPSSG
jgi:hypothetical protein